MNLKDSRNWQLTSSSSSNEHTNASFEEVKGKRGRKGDERSYHTNSFTSVPIGKTLNFDGIDYTKWRYLIKMYLILLNTSVCTFVRTCVNFLDGDEEPRFEQLQQIHRNATLVLLFSLEKDEFDRVNGLEKARIFVTLFKEPMKTPSP
jgi:hypothetical protein